MPLGSQGFVIFSIFVVPDATPSFNSKLTLSSLRQVGFRALWVLLAATIFIAAPSASLADSERSIPMADGFDYPIGKPDGTGYYLRRGYYPNAHMGEDWNGKGGGNSDLGDPVYAIGNGLVVYSQNYGSSWGNLVILRHAYREKNGRVYFVDSLYAHLDKRSVSVGSTVSRGQVVGTIGTAGGLYVAHLHFEVRKNLAIGPWQSSHGKTYDNYHSPRHFIEGNRNLRKEYRKFRVPVDTFTKTPTATNNVASATRVEISTRGATGSADRPTVPAPVRTVIESQSSENDGDSRSFWQRLKGRLGFGRKE